jgi:hypothetical protein
MISRILLLLCIPLVPFSSIAQAQFADSLKIEVGTTGTYASKEYQPLWLVANKFGTIADRKSDFSTNVRLSNFHWLGSKAGSDTTHHNFYINYGLSVFNNQHFSETFVEEGYVKAGYKKWQIRAGRYEETTGDFDPTLSSGSLGISGNALPIPKIGIAIVDYIPVPFTNGLVSFKGQVSHGWFGNNRFMKDAYLHEKIFYLQLGKRKLKLYAGVQHFAEWGGRRGNFQLEKSWKGFLDVLLVREADDGSVGTGMNGILPNRPGDQRGLLEAGFKWENDKIILNGYQQTPFETGRDVDIRNIDRLIGFGFTSKKPNSIIKKVVAELLYTKDMLSFVEQSDRQSFYNNGFYRTGWEYQNNIIGTPLFINRVRASKYFAQYKSYNWDAPDSTIYGNDNIVNNRVIGLHLGFLYKITSKVEAKTFVTYTRNYGTHSTTSPFLPHKTQLYTLQQLTYKSPFAGLLFTGAVGFDSGDLTKNTGFILGIKKQFGYNEFKFKK